MKCPNCGGETYNNICEFCGSEISNLTQNNVEHTGKCPQCGSPKIKFQRESLGVKGSRNSIKIAKGVRVGSSNYNTEHRTIGICQNCGYTWQPNHENKKRHGILWWILAVMFWPISLSVWFYKSPKIKLNKKKRIIILVVVWIVLLIFGYSTPDEEPSTTESTTTSIVQTTEETLDETEVTTTELETTSSPGSTTELTTTTTTTTTTKPTSTTKKVTTTKKSTTTQKSTSKTVYVTPTGKKYHYDGHCNGGTYNPSTLDEAKSHGLTPCKKCVG